MEVTAPRASYAPVPDHPIVTALATFVPFNPGKERLSGDLSIPPSPARRHVFVETATHCAVLEAGEWRDPSARGAHHWAVRIRHVPHERRAVLIRGRLYPCSYISTPARIILIREAGLALACRRLYIFMLGLHPAPTEPLIPLDFVKYAAGFVGAGRVALVDLRPANCKLYPAAGHTRG